MSGEEREILLAAQEKAMDVLSAATAKASRVTSEAEADAIALMLEQQKRAEDLIQQAQEDAAEHAEAGDGTSVLESHRTAAEVLAATEQEVAAKLRETTTNAGVDVLMAAQREAAAILLEAWMKVTEGRPSPGERSG